YTREDVPAADDSEPGAFPYPRGIRAVRRGSWIQRGLSGEGDARHSNAQIKALLEKGQTGIDVIGDSPTMGLLDPDAPLARAAVGSQGVSLSCLEDYRELLDGLPLESMTISSSVPAPFFVAGLVLVAKERGVPLDKLRGSVLQPPFYAEDCGYAMHLPFALRMRLACDSIEYCSRELPRFHGYLEDTYFFSEVGLTPAEEMALGFLQIRHVSKELVRRGVEIDRFAPRIAILVNCSMSLFHEVAKIRAARRLFATMMRDEFGAKDPRSHSVVIACHTSGLSLTAQQPVNNVVRGALQAMALVMAGVQAMEISAFDEGYRTPGPEAHLVGLRTQQILELETDVAQTIDPLGGSYFIERLTDEMEQEIRAVIERFESKGTPEQLCERGVFAAFFAEAMDRRHRALSSGELKQVGVNVHRLPPEEDRLLRGEAEAKGRPWHSAIERSLERKRARDPEVVGRGLDAVAAAARDRDRNLMPALVAAMADGLTVGEITQALRRGYGLAEERS
ncbi:MAG TPA: methylmalonyl-CoA mutase family protein, partial [Myxococcales bacterium]|nr:methylmalonyl-CoA mutase family protein [Myxococcales bacterium]